MTNAWIQPQGSPRLPSVRGILLWPALDWLGSLLARERLAPQSLPVDLRPADLELLVSRPQPDRWVPVGRVDRIEQALVAAHGGDRQEVLRELGARAALAAVKIGSPAAAWRRLRAAAEDTRRGPFSFGRMSVQGESLRRFRVLLHGAGPLPESTRIVVQSFLTQWAAGLAHEPLVGRSLCLDGRVLFDVSPRKADAVATAR